MKYGIITLFLAALAGAQDGKLTEVQTLKLRNIELQYRIATDQQARAQAEVSRLMAEYQKEVGTICEAAKIDAKACVVDLNAGTVTKRPELKDGEKEAKK